VVQIVLARQQLRRLRSVGPIAQRVQHPAAQRLRFEHAAVEQNMRGHRRLVTRRVRGQEGGHVPSYTGVAFVWQPDFTEARRGLFLWSVRERTRGKETVDQHADRL
jgi:hypothetical protein